MSDKNPDFEKWARKDRWFLEEGVMLLLGVEPFDHDHVPHGWQRIKKSFEEIYDTAARSIDADTLRAFRFRLPSKRTVGHGSGGVQYRWQVNPRDLTAWARKKGFPLPRELEEAVNRFHPEAEDRPQGDADRPKWSSYETELLRLLARAAEKFWNNYDPSDPTTTVPSNKVVAGWLVEQGISERKAEVMAAILRPDGL